MRRILVLMTVAAMMTAMLAVLAGTAAAHPHVVKNPNHDQQLANGQLHPGFVYDEGTNLSTACEGVIELPYGLETAHHGPDAGTPGKADGCYAAGEDNAAPPPPDTNPAID
jgi:hypothetical protein